MTEQLPDDPAEKAEEVFDHMTVFHMVGKYTLIVVFLIAACLVSMGFGWPWWIAGLGPVVLIPMLALGFSLALDKKIKERK